MKFTASSADLLKALNTVGGAVPSKSTLAILECILFERDGDHLVLSATDLEISIIQRVSVQFEGNDTEKPERIAVPAKRLLDTLRALPNLPISFTNNETFQLTLTTDQGQYKMSGMDGADYPALPTLEEGQHIETSGTVLKRAIQKTGFAVSRDALRPAMMGIYFDMNTEGSEIVATDGHRLVRFRVRDLQTPEALKMIIPEKALTLVGRTLTDSPCTLSTDTSFVGFSFDQTTVLARLIDETYPNYEAVIPLENDRKLTVSRNALLAAVKRVALYSSTMTHQVRLSLKANEMEISAEDIERSSEAHETVLCEYDHEALDIGFNAVYLTEVLNNIDAEDMVFEFSSPNRAGVITPSEQREGEDMMMLIMPVMLNTYA